MNKPISLMRKIMNFAFLLIFLLSITGCFEVTEEVKMNKDGSGELRLHIDLSASKSNLTTYLDAGEINGVEIPTKDEIKLEIKKLKKKLRKMKGISNVNIESDFTEFVFELTSNFSDVKTLNKAINAAVKSFNQTPFPIKKYKHFATNDGQFSRLFEYTDERFTQDEFDGFGSVVRYLMESAKLISIYRFEEPIDNFSNNNAQLSPSKKAIKLEGNIVEFATGKVTLENHISF